MIALALSSTRYARPGRVGAPDAKDVTAEAGGASAAGVCIAFAPATGGVTAAVAPLCYIGGKWVTGAAIEYGSKVIEAVKCTFSICGEWKGSNRDEAFESTRAARYRDLWDKIAPLCKKQDCGARLDALINWYVDGWKHINIEDPRYQESTAEKVNVFKDHGWQRFLDDVSAYYRDTLTPQLQIALQQLLNEQEPDYVPGDAAGDVITGASTSLDKAKPGLSTGTKITAAAVGVGALWWANRRGYLEPVKKVFR